MFGGSKPTFGSTGTGFGSFNTATTTSPFGQTAFGKPATSTFGGAPAFGAQQTAPMFGAPAGQAQTSAGLFGATNTAVTSFGATSNQSGFGAAFSQPQQTTSIFGANQGTANNSLFSQQPQSAFAPAVKPTLATFGQTATTGTGSMFGQTATTSLNNTSSFGGFGQVAPATSAFGATGTSAFGPTGAAGMAGGSNLGSSIVKYNPIMGTDTLMKGGQTNNVNTKQHCITAMKEYEAKSLEEIRIEDYMANRKGPQASTSGAGNFFGSTQQPAATSGIFGATGQQNTSLFAQQVAGGGATDNKSIFGTTAFGATGTTSTFGTTANQNSFMAKPFGVTAANTSFGTTTTDGANPFGAKTAFGQPVSGAAPNMFGQPTVATAGTGFAQPTSGFTGFATQPGAQQPTMFGQPTNDPNKSAFGLTGASTTNTGFSGFGAVTSNAANANMFGAKTTTGFGALPAFGATSTANTGFSNFTMNNQATTGTGSIFNTSLNKPATSGFAGFAVQPTTAPLNFNAGNTNNSLFSNMAAKPTGLFANTLGNPGTNTTGAGMFAGGNTTGFGTTLGGGGGISNFGTTSLGGGNTTLGLMGGTGGQSIATPPIHQQILSRVTSPYGDNPIFKDLKRNDEMDATRATNPTAIKAIIENSPSFPQFSLSARSTPIVVRVTPITNSSAIKKALFEGLDEIDSKTDSFTMKSNVKRLILKPKSNTGTPVSSKTCGTYVSGGNTPLRQIDNSNTPKSAQRESFNEEIAADVAAAKESGSLGNVQSKENEISRRESWLHPNNLEKVRQMNAAVAGNSAGESPGPLNNTLSELMPRKPLDTYRSPSVGARLSVSTVLENPFEDEGNSVSRRDNTIPYSEQANESLSTNRSYVTDERNEELDGEYEEHPTGIILRRAGYYIIPSLDELKSYLAEDGSCVVPNFTIGREGYGNVYFGKEMDVAGLNLDEIVHFRNKQIVIYPDDENKPDIGQGLNREAQITLDQVWPHDKDKHELIKDPGRLAETDWEGKLRRICNKNDTRFVEYRPETGSWVFRVKHFSKYGLSDSDEDEEPLPADPKKAKMGVPALPGQRPVGGPIGSGADGVRVGATDKSLESLQRAQKTISDPKTGAVYSMDESAEFMLMDKTQYFQRHDPEYSMFDQSAKTANNEIIGPTTALARLAGTDSHKLQLMKASLFVDDEEDNTKKTSGARNVIFQNRERRSSVGLSHYADVDQSDSSSQLDFGVPSMHAASSAASMLSIVRETQSDTSSPAAGSESTMTTIKPITKVPPFMFRPKVAPIRCSASQVPFVTSIAYALRNKWTCDLGLYKSRHFKVGFGLQLNVIVPNTRENVRSVQNEYMPNCLDHVFKPRDINDFSAMVLQQVKIASIQHYPNFHESIVKHLQIQLDNSVLEEVVDSKCPWIRSNAGSDLIVKHLDQAYSVVNLGPLEQYAVSVWSLCLTLWGEHEEMEGQESNSHFVVMARRNLFSEWLENTITDKRLLNKNVTPTTYLDHMIELVTCHKVAEACDLAFLYDDANMALLLSQLSSGPTVRRLMEDQLAAWHRDEADTFIQLERLKLFMLVAGVSLMSSAHGPINTLEDIEWIKVLAIQLWYLCSPTASITDALLSYEKSFKAEEFYSQPPLPAYMDATIPTDTTSLLSEKDTIYDLRYHLLQLYSRRSHPMEPLINPDTHTTDPMDYRLSWLILQTLEALGYRHCSMLTEAQLHVNFATQLENYGLWEWSVFVLLHIKDQAQRESAVQNILYRHVIVSAKTNLSEKEKFIVLKLGVPEKWIDYAKAVRAGAMFNYHLQAKYLLKAKQWSLAHGIIFDHIAPDAIINGNLKYLHELLGQFESIDVLEQKSTVKVPNWSNQGQIFLDFIDITEKFKSLKLLNSQADIEARWESLKPHLADLCSRINLLPCPTAKHRLCQSEIAQSLACLIRGVLVVCPVLNPCLVLKIALERLPLPQEFAQQELRALLDAVMDDLKKSATAGNSLELEIK